MKKVMMAMVAATAVGVHTQQAGADEQEPSLSFSGDMRLRHEYIDQDDKATDRHRQRVRARLAAKAQVNENVKGEMRAVSGGEDPVSTNQSFDDAFTSKGLQLDRAYLVWGVLENVDLVGGKMKRQWIEVSDLLWDGDLSPEGLSATAALDGEVAKVTAIGGYYWLDEISSSDEDRVMYSGQVAAEAMAGEGAKVLVGGGIHVYDNMQGLAPLVDEADGFGNSVIETVDAVTGESTFTYASDYTIYELFAKLSTSAGDLPLSVFGHLAMNDDASSEDQAYLFGVKLGKASAPGTWQASYDYRTIDADAIVGAFTDSDFGGGGTGADGHRLKAKVGLADNWTAGATLLLNELSSGADYTRLQLDLVAKF